MPALKVSLVATVLNEYGSLPGWLDSLSEQTRLPDECLIVDGGSTDGSLEYLQSSTLPFELKLFSAPGATIAQGRNIGLRAATGEIVAVTDAGTRADIAWLDLLVAPFERAPEIDITAGFFVPATSNVWSEALGAATLPDASEVDPGDYLASSRSVALRRRWIDAGFEYPEWLDYCEDLIFDLQLRRAGARQQTALEAVVAFEPRPGPVSFFKQYYRYARGDGKSGLFFQRHLIRYAAYVTALAVLWRRKPLELMVVGFGVAFNLRKPVHRLSRRSGKANGSGRLVAVVGLAALQTGIGDVAKMLGYPTGLLWRLRRDRSVRFWRTGWKARHSSGCLPRI